MGGTWLGTRRVHGARPVTVVFRGMTLDVEDIEAAWVVRQGTNEVTARRLDEALTTLLDVRTSELLALMRLIVEAQREL